MDLNHTPLTNYKHEKLPNPYQYHKSNQSDTSHTIAEEIRTQEAIIKNLRKPSDLSELDLKNGQILRGEVVDYLGNRVSIRLEASDQIISARLESNITLPIGETAQFQVLEISSGKLLLKLIPSESKHTYDATIEKALTVASLPLTTRNKALVMELLNHRLSIDKNTLQTIIKLSHKHQEASPLTLVLMMKYDIPITKENISQFQAYQNGRKEFTNHIETILKNIGKLQELIKKAAPENDPSNLSHSIPSDIIQNESIHNDIIHNDSVHNDNVHNDSICNDNIIKDSIPKEANPIALSHNNQSNSIGGMDHPIASGNSNLQSSLTYDNSFDRLLLINQTLLELLEPATAVQSNMQTNTIPRNPDTTRELHTILSPPEIENLIEKIRVFPDADNIIKEIEQDTAPIQKVLNYIKHKLSHMERRDVVSFLSTEEYGKLLEAALHQKWALTPERLAKKDAVKEYYQNLEKDIEILRNIIQTEKETSELLRFQEPVKNLKENIDFLKDLNQVFTYLPLPIQLKEQDAHCDFYVFTRKKALKNPKDGLSVLLHLTMANLGALNIHIHMEGNQISAKFYMEDTTSIQLLSEHMEKLTNALREKGFSLHAEVLGTYKKPNFVQDFLEADLQDGLIQRYSFDIRT
ncbi:MAG: flagellar hook-length control protein FliK [Clostridiales bacterium]|nr:flagellar hook-length control protein FliK [Clostridiales bacterium]